MSIENFKIKAKELYQVEEYSRQFKFELDPPEFWDGKEVDFEIDMKDFRYFKIPSKDVHFKKSGTILVDSKIPDSIKSGKGDVQITATFTCKGLKFCVIVVKDEVVTFQWI